MISIICVIRTIVLIFIVISGHLRLRQEGSRVRKEGSRDRKEGFRVRQEIPEEGRRAHRLKRCTDNNEDEDNRPNNADNAIILSIKTNF